MIPECMKLAHPLLQIENLSVMLPTARGAIHAVRDVSLHLEQGEMLALVGESGCGKSITAQAITGLLPDTATVKAHLATFRQHPLLTGKYQQGIAMIFQNPMATFNPVLTIGYQIAEPLRVLHGYNRQDAETETIRLLERMQISDAREKARRYAHKFSGGMLQRAAIAMALACKPQLLIADEPTTALDVSTQAEVMALLAELRKEQNLALLFITHDLALVARHADRIAVMYAGEIVETNTTQALLDNPQHPYTRKLLAAYAKTTHSNAIPAAEPLLRVENLYKRFGDKNKTAALDNINLHVNAGEIMGLAGESGSGKSTLARCIAGLHTHSSGNVYFHNECLPAIFTAKDFHIQAKRVQMIFQDPLSSLNPRLTIGDILLEPLRLNNDLPTGQQQALAVRWLEKMGLKGSDMSRYPHSFSGGQLQRIGIARALINQPQLLICDEPVSALDVSTQAQIIQLLRDLRDELGLTLLFISHDLATMRHLCDRIAIMHKGVIVEQGHTADVLDNPQHTYTQKLVASSPVIL